MSGQCLAKLFNNLKSRKLERSELSWREKTALVFTGEAVGATSTSIFAACRSEWPSQCELITDGASDWTDQSVLLTWTRCLQESFKPETEELLGDGLQA